MEAAKLNLHVFLCGSEHMAECASCVSGVMVSGEAWPVLVSQV